MAAKSSSTISSSILQVAADIQALEAVTAATQAGGLFADMFSNRLAGAGTDTISGFVAGAGSDDVINLSLGAAFDTFAEVIGAATQVGADVIISFGGGDSITLLNTTLASLHADDFIYS